MNKKMLALDQALGVSGWSIFENRQLVAGGKFTIKPTLPIEQRLNEFMQHISELHNQYQFTSIAFEDIQLQCGKVSTYQKLAYVQAALMIWCYNNNVKYKILAPSHWRKILKDKCGVSFGRKREEQKQNAINFVKDKFDLEVTTDEADSICIGFAAQLERVEVQESAF